MKTYVNGTSSLQNFDEFIRGKLNANDYAKAEELLNAAIAEISEQKFKDGCKYTYGLAQELSGKD